MLLGLESLAVIPIVVTVVVVGSFEDALCVALVK